MFIISDVNLRTIDILKNISRIVAVIIAMLVLILLVVVITYKPAYQVTMKQNVVGYIDNKDEFISKVDGYINQENENIAYIDMQEIPEYKFMLVQRDKFIDNEQTYQKVISYADVYTRVHTIFVDDVEIAMLPIQVDVETVLKQMVETAGNTNVKFTVKEANLIEPKVSTVDNLVALVQEQYRAVVKKTALSTIKSTNRGTYIDTGIDFETPLKGTITSRYGYRGKEFHTGLDIAKPINTPIYAAATGEVIFSGVKGSYGNIVIIQHADNVITYYAHCNELLVHEGDFVLSGDKIATIGMTGRTTGPHLHFEVRINGKTVNPEQYIYNVTQ